MVTIIQGIQIQMGYKMKYLYAKSISKKITFNMLICKTIIQSRCKSLAINQQLT